MVFRKFNEYVLVSLVTVLVGCSTLRRTVKVEKSGGITEINNGLLSVSYDENSKKIILRSIVSLKKLDATLILDEKFNEVKIEDINSDKFGAGKAIIIAHPSGSIDRVALYPNENFAFYNKIIKNSSAKAITVSMAKTVSLNLNINSVPNKELCANGTFGLRKIDGYKHGSYCYAAIANPKTRSGFVTGWISSDRGSGVVYVYEKNKKTFVDTKIDFGKLLIAPKSTETTETLVIGGFDDARIGLEKFADVIAKNYDIKLKPQPTVYCTWYHYFRDINEKILKANLKTAKKELQPFGLSVFQLDDGYQTGECNKDATPWKNFLNWDKKKFPNGAKSMSKTITDAGFVSGLWYMPFSGSYNSSYFADKKNIFAMKGDKPFDASWGGNPFDLSKPEALAFVAKVAKTVCKDWGFKYIKIDGLWAGTVTRQKYVNTEYSDDNMGEAPLADSNITNLQAYRMGLKTVRNAAGDDVFILGCNSPQNMRTFAGTFGLVDGMRIGPDNGCNYPAITDGALFGSRFYFLHNRVWHNDPDPLYTRNSIPISDAQMLASWVTITGQMDTTSETYANLKPERLDIIKRTMPSHNLKARPADYFTNGCPSVWLLSDTKRSARRDVVGLFNWGVPKNAYTHLFQKMSEKFSYDLDWIGLDSESEYVGFEFWTNKFIPPFSKKLQYIVPVRSARVISLKKCSNEPQILSTSRHITQGIVDIVSEHYNKSTDVYSGISKLVANDPYEIRIASGKPSEPLKCIAASLSEQDVKAGVKIKVVSQDGWKLRVLINTPVSRNVNWSLKFKK